MYMHSTCVSVCGYCKAVVNKFFDMPVRSDFGRMPRGGVGAADEIPAVMSSGRAWEGQF